MIILDTNVISEFMTHRPKKSVLDWLNQQSKLALYISTISIAEIGYGLRLLSNGKRKQALTEKFEQLVKFVFEQRVLSFDQNAAKVYADIMANRREIGRPMSSLDGQIASIAKANRFSVVTRNIKDFEFCEVELINPFID